MRYILLNDEYTLLEKSKKDLEFKYREQWKRKWEACEQWAETWHDNFDFEDATRCQELIAEQIKKINLILRWVEIINISSLKSLKEDIVTIWKIVSLSINWKKTNIIIWWYNTLVGWRVSYNSPLVKWILGKKEWDILNIETPKWVKEIEILKITILN